jgi:hypothetical protein
VKRLAAAALAAAALSGCARTQIRPPPDIGVTDCPPNASSALLSVDALQCWLPSPHGRWRTLSHDSHFNVLVVQTEATDLRDAVDIARAFSANQGSAFSEILIYVREPSRGDRVRTRRVRWTKAGGFETFDFTAP